MFLALVVQYIQVFELDLFDLINITNKFITQHKLSKKLILSYKTPNHKPTCYLYNFKKLLAVSSGSKPGFQNYPSNPATMTKTAHPAHSDNGEICKPQYKGKTSSLWEKKEKNTV